MDNIKLKVCPFCEGKVEFINRKCRGNDEWDIRCTTEECFLEDGADYAMDNKDELAELWNNREYYERRKVEADLRECPFCGEKQK